MSCQLVGWMTFYRVIPILTAPLLVLFLAKVVIAVSQHFNNNNQNPTIGAESPKCRASDMGESRHQASILERPPSVPSSCHKVLCSRYSSRSTHANITRSYFVLSVLLLPLFMWWRQVCTKRKSSIQSSCLLPWVRQHLDKVIILTKVIIVEIQAKS